MIIDIKQIDPFSLPSVEFNEIGKMPVEGGIYFAISGENILYIGMSVNLQNRWHRHHRYQQFKSLGNVTVAWVLLSELERDDLKKLEDECICYFKPSLNYTISPIKVSKARIAFGERLRQLRQQEGMTQEKLASVANLSDKQIRNMERGAHATSLDVIEKLAEALEIPIKALFDFPD